MSETDQETLELKVSQLIEQHGVKAAVKILKHCKSTGLYKAKSIYPHGVYIHCDSHQGGLMVGSKRHQLTVEEIDEYSIQLMVLRLKKAKCHNRSNTDIRKDMCLMAPADRREVNRRFHIHVVGEKNAASEPALTRELACCKAEDQFAVTWTQRIDGTHEIIYGLHGGKYDKKDHFAAAQEFGECVHHMLEASGAFDEPEPGPATHVPTISISRHKPTRS